MEGVKVANAMDESVIVDPQYINFDLIMNFVLIIMKMIHRKIIEGKTVIRKVHSEDQWKLVTLGADKAKVVDAKISLMISLKQHQMWTMFIPGIFTMMTNVMKAKIVTVFKKIAMSINLGIVDVMRNSVITTDADFAIMHADELQSGLICLMSSTTNIKDREPAGYTGCGSGQFRYSDINLTSSAIFPSVALNLSAALSLFQGNSTDIQGIDAGGMGGYVCIEVIEDCCCDYEEGYYNDYDYDDNGCVEYGD
ncbi:MAG: hypothetical protein EZS28_021895 [Streblomastix strix]|uniref:Uncharacterized protein n=1 Tax=Streblomastix strix TaxID=222440 RepID=A0A5J4VIU9_9EUKA|nr:MAG: hypothetical protein EZS28_021895 [Streblomastix strix]